MAESFHFALSESYPETAGKRTVIRQNSASSPRLAALDRTFDRLFRHMSKVIRGDGAWILDN